MKPVMTQHVGSQTKKTKFTQENILHIVHKVVEYMQQENKERDEKN